MIKGETREVRESKKKKVGIMTVNVIAINPTLKEKEEILGHTIDWDNDKEMDYTGESNDGNSYTRLDFWVKKEGEEFTTPIVFFVEDKEVQSKSGEKFQFINNIGNCSWAESDMDLKPWFTTREFRNAKSGEENLYKLLRTWLGKLDFSKEDTELSLDFKKLLKGDVSSLKEQVGGELCVPFCILTTVSTKTRENKDTGEEEIVQYQRVYTKSFLPFYCFKFFKLNEEDKEKYSQDVFIDRILKTQLRDLPLHEKFIANVVGEYGCKDYFVLREDEDYDPDNDLVTSNSAILEKSNKEDSDDPEY
jgi:hypothetical protein